VTRLETGLAKASFTAASFRGAAFMTRFFLAPVAGMLNSKLKAKARRESGVMVTYDASTSKLLYCIYRPPWENPGLGVRVLSPGHKKLIELNCHSLVNW
jgi:hypothetical protein